MRNGWAAAVVAADMRGGTPVAVTIGLHEGTPVVGLLVGSPGAVVVGLLEGTPVAELYARESN